MGLVARAPQFRALQGAGKLRTDLVHRDHDDRARVSGVAGSVWRGRFGVVDRLVSGFGRFGRGFRFGRFGFGRFGFRLWRVGGDGAQGGYGQVRVI